MRPSRAPAAARGPAQTLVPSGGGRRAPAVAGWTAALLTVAAVATPLATPLAGQSLADARTAFRTGAYDDAARTYRRVLRRDAGSDEARRGLVATLLRTGAYREAVEAARAAPRPGAVAAALGEALVAVGDLAGAETALRDAAASGPNRLAARVALAEVLLRTGRTDEAMALFDTFIDVYNGADGSLTAGGLLAVGRAVRHLGRRDPALFQDALRAFDEAAAADPSWPEPRVALGELFLEKYQSPEAQAEFERALALDARHPRALLGLAKALEFDGSAEARARAEAALEVDPTYPEAHAFLARLHLTREGHAEARTEAEAALEANPASLEALSALAAAHYVAGDEEAFRAVRARALAINPRYAGLDATVARSAEQVRRYAQAVEQAAAAVALDSTDWAAWGLLGMNQLRTGHIDEGRTSLERAFAGDPYNPWFKNNLDLLDTFERFVTVPTEHFVLFLHGTEVELLEPLVSTIAEEAFDSLSRRYGTEPPLPIRLELYPSHADFSVRTLGEVGLGALGVSFGSVLVMDSPAGRARGEYNWASTLWHELAHAFHLGMTEHRVPRWFSEGLAVHEQRKGREGWGHQPNIPFLQALREGRLKKVSELNDGFMRPDYPQQVIFSYYQASLVFELLESRHGFGTLRAMLDGYRDGATTEELFERVVGQSLEDFDDDFDAWIRERFRAPLAGVAALGEVPPPQAGTDALRDYVRAHPGDLVARMRLGAVLAREERYEEARPHLDEALRIFPGYGGPDSPYGYLARIHEASGDLQRAAAALARLDALSESNVTALLEEARLSEALGRPERALWALDRITQIYPYDPGLHTRMAKLYGQLGDPSGAVRARAAVVALDPADRAEALYLLALAQRDAGDRTAARRTVLRALDVAPSYEAALELLLELRAGTEEGA